MSKHQWTPEQIAWMREHYQAMDRNMLREAFNAKFGCAVVASQIRAALSNYKIRQHMRTGRIAAGSASWNKGVTGFMGANRTSFKKGNRPHNTRELWSERVDVDGYIKILVPEQNPYTGSPTRFVNKHVWVWEQANGQCPKGSTIIFRDGDRSNFELGNLVMVTRAELLVLNLHDYKNQPAELKPAILLLAKMEAKAGIRPRSGRSKTISSKEAV